MTITQEDRDAAAQAFFCKPLRNEKHNDDRRVKAFAVHRIAAEKRGIERAAKAIEADALTCDCHAREEGECACGAWCEWKSITSARAVDIIRALGD